MEVICGLNVVCEYNITIFSKLVYKSKFNYPI